MKYFYKMMYRTGIVVLMKNMHHGCEERILKSLPLREELALEKVQCPANHVAHYSRFRGSPAESCAKMPLRIIIYHLFYRNI
jgi:hypothetical protein